MKNMWTDEHGLSKRPWPSGSERFPIRPQKRAQILVATDTSVAIVSPLVWFTARTTFSVPVLTGRERRTVFNYDQLLVG
jgi:hypothetical protein